MECRIVGCESTNLIYSGVDALMYGVPTETFCYKCAGIYAVIKLKTEMELVKN